MYLIWVCIAVLWMCHNAMVPALCGVNLTVVPLPDREFASGEGIYNKAIAAMEAHNADVTQTDQQGINQFSDLTLCRSLQSWGF